MQGCHKAWGWCRNYSNEIWKTAFQFEGYFYVYISLGATLTAKFLNWQIIKTSVKSKHKHKDTFIHKKNHFATKLFVRYHFLVWAFSVLLRWHLVVQNQHLKHQNNKGNTFKVNNKDTRFSCFHCLLWTSKYRLSAFMPHSTLIIFIY